MMGACHLHGLKLEQIPTHRRHVLIQFFIPSAHILTVFMMCHVLHSYFVIFSSRPFREDFSTSFRSDPVSLEKGRGSQGNPSTRHYVYY